MEGFESALNLSPELIPAHAFLAAAYAEAGRFDDAVDAQERAVAKARAEQWSAEDIADLEDRLRLYREGRPFRVTR